MAGIRRSAVTHYPDTEGLVHWRLAAPNGRAIAHSPDGFVNEFDAYDAFEHMRREVDRMPMGIHHSEKCRGWIWVLTDDAGQRVAVASRTYERYDTCKLAYQRFRRMLASRGERSVTPAETKRAAVK